MRTLLFGLFVSILSFTLTRATMEACSMSSATTVPSSLKQRLPQVSAPTPGHQRHTRHSFSAPSARAILSWSNCVCVTERILSVATVRARQLSVTLHHGAHLIRCDCWLRLAQMLTRLRECRRDVTRQRLIPPVPATRLTTVQRYETSFESKEPRDTVSCHQHHPPDHALQRSRLERRGRNRGVPWAGPVTLGRSA